MGNPLAVKGLSLLHPATHDSNVSISFLTYLGQSVLQTSKFLKQVLKLLRNENKHYKKSYIFNIFLFSKQLFLELCSVIVATTHVQTCCNYTCTNSTAMKHSQRFLREEIRFKAPSNFRIIPSFLLLSVRAHCWGKCNKLSGCSSHKTRR